MEKIRLLPSGINDFERVRRDNLYYVDKTQFIATLEGGDSYVFFGRPRRFGKSLFVSMLEAYYDIKNKDRFDELFSGLWIHEHPTERRAFYQVLKLDFSQVDGKVEKVEEKFNEYCCVQLEKFAKKYAEAYDDDYLEGLKKYDNASGRLTYVTSMAALKKIPLYLIVDEYDNFTNTILSLHGKEMYTAITHGEGFYRELFKKFKGNFERIFLTGVSPVTLEDLTSGFNIASYISQYQELNQMLGFSEVDVKEMIKYYHSVGKIKGDLAQQTDFIISTIKPWCDNYYFSSNSFEANEPPMYNGMMVMYYLNRYMQDGKFPEDMTAPNTMIDYGKLDHLVKIEQEMGNDYRNSFINKAVSSDFILGHVKEHFAAINILEDENFISLMYYYGMLTICGGFGALLKLRIPNNNIRKQFYTYIRSRFPKAAAVNIAELEIQFANAAILGEWKEMLTYIATSYSKASSTRNTAEGERNIQGYFMAYLNLAPYYLMCPELECNHGYCDIFLMPDRHVSDVQHSYIIEFKYISTKEKPEKTQEKFAEAKAQLEVYAADEKVKNFTKDTTLHKIVMVFRGAELELMEEVN